MDSEMDCPAASAVRLKGGKVVLGAADVGRRPTSWLPGSRHQYRAPKWPVGLGPSAAYPTYPADLGICGF